jgi:hypothetical protein
MLTVIIAESSRFRGSPSPGLAALRFSSAGYWHAAVIPAQMQPLLCVFRTTAQKRGKAVADELAHNQRGVGALDAGNGQDLPGDAV